MICWHFIEEEFYEIKKVEEVHKTRITLYLSI